MHPLHTLPPKCYAKPKYRNGLLGLLMLEGFT